MWCGVAKVRCGVAKARYGVAKMRCGVAKVWCGVASWSVALLNGGLFFKEILSKGSASPEVELRFCTWLLLFQYCTAEPDLRSYLFLQ